MEMLFKELIWGVSVIGCFVFVKWVLIPYLHWRITFWLISRKLKKMAKSDRYKNDKELQDQLMEISDIAKQAGKDLEL